MRVTRSKVPTHKSLAVNKRSTTEQIIIQNNRSHQYDDQSLPESRYLTIS